MTHDFEYGFTRRLQELASEEMVKQAAGLMRAVGGYASPIIKRLMASGFPMKSLGKHPMANSGLLTGGAAHIPVGSIGNWAPSILNKLPEVMPTNTLWKGASAKQATTLNGMNGASLAAAFPAVGSALGSPIGATLRYMHPNAADKEENRDAEERLVRGATHGSLVGGAAGLGALAGGITGKVLTGGNVPAWAAAVLGGAGAGYLAHKAIANGPKAKPGKTTKK